MIASGDVKNAYLAAAGLVPPFCRILRWPWWFRGFRGFTLGVLIFVKDPRDVPLVCHEMQHVAQFLRQPFTFWFRYLVELARHGYRNNRYEIEAREVESAVRRGISR